MSDRVLWLSGAKGISSRLKFRLDEILLKASISPASVIHATLWRTIPDVMVPKGKNKWVLNQEKLPQIEAALDKLIATFSPKVIVANDDSVLRFVTQSENSLNVSRGSVYHYKGVPVLCVDRLSSIFEVNYGSWIMLSDIGKLARWVKDKQKPQPPFTYKVCRTLGDCQEAERFLDDAIAISTDIETKDGITCIGYTGLSNDGRVETFVFPFLNPLVPTGCFWQTEADEVWVWQTIKRINANRAIKFTQNGAYDAAYFIAYRIPLRNWFVDTYHLFHCIYPEAPKTLNFIASMVLDYVQYWKDENKAKKEERLPNTQEKLERYWRYNALDCYYTLLSGLAILQAMTKIGWARENYNVEFRSQVGPALAMSMRGFKWDQSRKLYYESVLTEEHFRHLHELKTMVDDEEFNPNSPPQVASLIYDVLGARPLKKRGKNANKLKRSTDEKVLRIIATQHPLIGLFIQKIWDTKKPANNISKYIRCNDLNGRFMYQMNAAGTKFGRYASTNHQFWCGTNIQNIPKKMRDMLVADDGYVLVEMDYSQSDAKFVAYECEDAKYIATMESGKDTHAIHGEFFFGFKYEEIVEGHKVGADWVDHPVLGVRQNTKRIVHGSNFQMAGFTLYITMGHEAVVAAATTMKKVNAAGQPPHLWTIEELVAFCDEQLERFHELYMGLRPWFKSSAQECARNGNRSTCAFGRHHLFFGNVLEDNQIQRELSSFFGQGGTAGNINRSLNHIYYRTDLEQRGLLLLTQSHDSIVFLNPKDKLEMIDEVLTIMQESVTIKGRSMFVPVDVAVGLTWGKGMMPYKKGVSYEDIVEHEREYAKKFQLN